MFKRVLLCYDGSAAGRRALRRGAELAILVNAEVHVLAIVAGGAANPAVIAGAAGHACIVDDASTELERLLSESIEKLRARGVAAHGHLASGNTVDQIVAYAKRLRADLIVLGHYPQPSGGFWWWSGNQRVSLAERTHCCIFVAVDGPSDLSVA